MTITVHELNHTNCRSYLLVSGSDAALVDPVRERVASYVAELARRKLKLNILLETHTHADHLMLSREDKKLLSAPLAMHKNSPSPIVDQHLEDGQELRLGTDTISVWHTPGHTPDSVCYVFAGGVLTGDTLLIDGSGRTDFPGGDAAAQYDAVTGRLFSLAGDTVVYPAHDYKGNTQSTIARERSANARFSNRSREEYCQLMAGLGLPLPDRIQQALQVNQSGFEADEVQFPAMGEVVRVASVSAVGVAEMLQGALPPVIIDVREPEEFVGPLGHIPGALLVPMDALEQRLPKLAGYVDRELVVVCRAGARSASAAAMLNSAGFARVSNLQDGMLAWVEAGLDVQR
ncbi:MAG TPA: MBL fold metallo-hydrolase [Polyangiaceae bacterium]|nr:MBL fold metallo-hydrolase [Polyangiaceae bacterium]